MTIQKKNAIGSGKGKESLQCNSWTSVYHTLFCLPILLHHAEPSSRSSCSQILVYFCTSVVPKSGHKHCRRPGYTVYVTTQCADRRSMKPNEIRSGRVYGSLFPSTIIVIIHPKAIVGRRVLMLTRTQQDRGGPHLQGRIRWA